MSKEYSPNPIGKGESVRLNIKGNQTTDTNMRNTFNYAESAEAEVRRGQHPVEAHFGPTTGRGPLGRGISKQLAASLGVLKDEE